VVEKVASKHWFEVRRRAWRQGHFQEERWGRLGADGAVRADWQPVGTLAVDAMIRYVGRSQAVARLQVKNARVHPHMDPREVAILWRVALDALVESGTAPDMQWSRNVFPYWFEWIPPRGSRGEMVQPFFLPVNPEAGAISLSTSFGMVSGNLWVCRGCRRPFQRSSTVRKCPDCHKAETLKTAAGLPRELVHKVWRPFRKRLDLRVLRGTMQPEERDRQKVAALRSLRDVGTGRLPLPEWREQWERQNSGR